MRSILVIDDTPEISTMVGLCMPQYHILSAFDGIIGLDILRSHKSSIDLIILDINMPRLDGRATLILIRNTFPTIPIRIFSAFVTPDVELLALELTGKPPIFKPVDIDELKSEIVKSLLQHTAAFQQTGVLGYAQSLAADLEQQGRKETPTTRVLICGSNRVITSGLKDIISSSRLPLIYLETGIKNINHFSHDEGPVIIVTTYTDFEFAITSAFPVFCICFSFLESIQAINKIKDINTNTKKEKTFSVIVDENTHSDKIATYIQEGIQELRLGNCYLPHQLKQIFFDPRDNPQLSPDERDLIRYQMLGKETKIIAYLLKSTPEAIRQLRSRLAKKLGMPPAEWHIWAEQWWRSHYP